MSTALTEPITLATQPQPSPAEDFVALKKQALAWLPRWASGEWTDFNEHDPGLMLLEELLYASTELPYRAQLDIPQLLDQGNGKVPWDENSIYPANRILPMQPLTAADFARLLYDRLPELVYVSVEPFNTLNAVLPSVAGRLTVHVAIDPDYDASLDAPTETVAPPPLDPISPAPAPATTPTANGIVHAPNPRPEAGAVVIAKVSALLAAVSNLGERFEAFAIMQPRQVALTIDLELVPGADPDTVAGYLYLAVKGALLPGPKFRPLNDALTTETMDEALSGPLLQRGVILDDDMPKLVTWPAAKTAVGQAVLATDGVKLVRAIQYPFESYLQAFTGPGLFTPAPEVTIDLLGSNATSTDRGARVYRVKFTSTASNVISLAVGGTSPRSAQLIASGGALRKVQFSRLLATEDALLPVAPGEPATGVSEYFSIQNQFPPCFGLQRGGLPGDATPQRRAQVKQLRGYLMVFEQLLANYLAQLGRTADYFSNLPQERTTFVQPLLTVPDVLPLVDEQAAADAPTNPSEQRLAEQLYWEDYATNAANPYRRGLDAATESATVFLQRRHRVLDHLLARFNECYPDDDRADYETIVNKQDLLQQYCELSVRRATAANPVGPLEAGKTRPTSGLEAKMRLLLRRDRQPAPGPLSHLPNIGPPNDFYFVIEPIRLLPRSAVRAPGTALAIPVSAFQSTLVHVLLNWTLRPLTPAFTSYVESRILDNAPAHLWHRFVWLETVATPDETKEAAAARKHDLASFHAAINGWASAGYPEAALAEVAPAPAPAEGAPPTEPMVTLVAGSPAAALLSWLPWVRPFVPAPSAPPADSSSSPTEGGAA